MLVWCVYYWYGDWDCMKKVELFFVLKVWWNCCLMLFMYIKSYQMNSDCLFGIVGYFLLMINFWFDYYILVYCVVKSLCRWFLVVLIV